MFGVEGSDVAVAALDVYCRFSSWSVGIRPFDPILKAFGSIAWIQYFFEKPFLISFVVWNYPVGPAVVFQIDNVLAGERGVVPADYRRMEDREYTAFGRQLDNDRSEIDFGDGVGADL